jgi:hypothetical protein
MTNSDFSPQTNPNYHPDQSLLHAFLDGELTQEETDRLKHHLGFCSACRENLEGLESLFSQLEELPKIPLEVNFKSKILQRVKRQQKLFQGLTWTAVLQAAAAGIILGLVLPILPYQEWSFTLQEILNQLHTNAAANFSRLMVEWSLNWADFSQSIPPAMESMLSTDFILLDLSEPLLVVIAAAVLGILANSILLRSGSIDLFSNHKSRT